MLMSRIVYISVAGILMTLNAAALALLIGGDSASRSVIMAALIINLLLWPLALVIAYRIGQATAALKAKAARGGHKH